MNEIDALINLIQDDDPQIVAVAMEKLLTLDKFINEKMPELQESNNPKIRKRIHQFASILHRREVMEQFLDRVNKNELDIWTDLVFLNKVFDNQLTALDAEQAFDKLCAKVPNDDLPAIKLASFMKGQNFSAPNEDLLDPSLFLINEVITSGIGNSLLNVVIADLIAQRFDKKFTIVLHKGRHCLIDSDHTFIDPQNNWSVNQLPKDSKVYPCSNKSILLTLISQLYLSALMEGHLRVIYQLSKMMAALSESDIKEFPYPIGEVGIPETEKIIG